MSSNASIQGEAMSSNASVQGSAKSEDGQTKMLAPPQDHPADSTARHQDFMNSPSSAVTVAGRESRRRDRVVATVDSVDVTMARVDNSPSQSTDGAENQPTNDGGQHARRRDEELRGVGTKFSSEDATAPGDEQ